MNYCSQCAAPVVLRVPPGDNLPRYVCDACDAVHYQNPKIVAGCLVESGTSILLCRRAIEPRSGLWTVPAGFMENGETLEQAARRETWEEAQAEVELNGLYGVYNIPHVNQVYVIYRGQLAGDRFAPGAESLEVALFERQQVPWDALAFQVIRATLKRYYEDLDRGDFPTHVDDIHPAPR